MTDTKSTRQSYSAPAQAEGSVRQGSAAAGRVSARAGHRLQVSKGDLTWQHGIHNVSAAHGQQLTERARDLVRRALGELYQEAQGGPQASTVAHSVAANIGNTGALNRLGAEAAAGEYRTLNQAGAVQEG